MDLSQFLGTWYRISSNPVVFEPKCLCARQVLSPSKDNRVAVYNSCTRDNSSRKIIEIKGFASALDNTGSKLSVDFGLPWKGSYWIIGFDPDQGYAVVTDKWGYSLYLMSRTPEVSSDLYNKMVSIAKNAGAETNRLQIQSHAACTYPISN